MAFTFIVETGAPVANATSYVSVSAADDYYAVDTNFTATWTAKTQDQKEKLLAWATRLLDQKTRWKGTRVIATQSLRWPRNYAYDCDDQLVSATVIPQGVIAATLELTKYINTNDLTTGRDTDGFKEIIVDVIELVFQDGDSQTTIPSIINAALCGLGIFGGSSGVSVFAPITKA